MPGIRFYAMFLHRQGAKNANIIYANFILRVLRALAV
jgi:hypothetical protein